MSNNEDERPQKKRRSIFGFFLSSPKESREASSPRSIRAIPSTNSLPTANDAPSTAQSMTNHASTSRGIIPVAEDNFKKRRASVVFQEEKEEAPQQTALAIGTRTAIPQSYSKRRRTTSSSVQRHRFRDEINRNHRPSNDSFVLPSNKTPGTIRSQRRRIDPRPQPPNNIQEQLLNRQLTANSLNAPQPQATDTAALYDIFEEWDRTEHDEVEEDAEVPESLSIPPVDTSLVGPHQTYQETTIFKPDPPLTQQAFDLSQAKLLKYLSTRKSRAVFETDEQMAKSGSASTKEPATDIWADYKSERLTKWKCAACDVKNQLNDTTCISCETPRYPTDASGESAAPAPGGIGPTGFSFHGTGASTSEAPATGGFGAAGFSFQGTSSSANSASAPTNGGFGASGFSFSGAGSTTNKAKAPDSGGFGASGSSFPAAGATTNKATAPASGGFGASGFSFPTASASGNPSTTSSATAAPTFGGSSIQNSTVATANPLTAEPRTNEKSKLQDSAPATNETSKPPNDTEPAFSFRVPTANSSTKPLLAFGAPANTANNDATKPAVASAPSGNTKPQISFGAPTTNNQESKPTFAFGTQQDSKTPVFGAPAKPDAKPASSLGESTKKAEAETSSEANKVVPTFGNKANDQGLNSFAAAPFGGRSREDSGAMSLGSDAAFSNNDIDTSADTTKFTAPGSFNLSSAPASNVDSSGNGSDGNSSKKPVTPSFGSTASAVAKSDGNVVAPTVPTFGNGSSTILGNAQPVGEHADQSKNHAFASSGTGTQNSSKKIEDVADKSSSTTSSNNPNPFGSSASQTFGNNSSGSAANNPFNSSNAVSSGLGGFSGDTSKRSNPFEAAPFGSRNNGGNSGSGFGSNGDAGFGAPSNAGSTSAPNTGTFRFGSTSAPASGGLGGAALAFGGFGSTGTGGTGGFGLTPAPVSSTGFGGPIKPASSGIGATSAFPPTPASAFPPPAFPPVGAPAAFGGTSTSSFPAPQFGGATGQPVQQFGIPQQATSFAPSGSANPPSFGQNNGGLGGAMNGGPNFGAGNTSQQNSFALGKNTGAAGVPGRRVVRARRPKR